MKPAHSLFVFALASPLFAQGPAPELDFSVRLVPGQVRFAMHCDAAPFVGVVVVSPTPHLAHFLVDLPPLLADGLVVAFGASQDTGYRVSLPEQLFPPGITLHAQGLALTNRALLASDVSEFVLDVTGEG